MPMLGRGGGDRRMESRDQIEIARGGLIRKKRMAQGKEYREQTVKENQP